MHIYPFFWKFQIFEKYRRCFVPDLLDRDRRVHDEYVYAGILLFDGRRLN